MRIWLFTIGLTLVLLLTACGGEKVETTMSEPVDDFEALTQDGDTMIRDDLLGKWWIADFVFTNCTTVCLPMTQNMKVLQDSLTEAGINNFHLVSFSVDPEYDTPNVLKQYAEEYGADLTSWTFLTGYTFETIKELSMGSFKSLVAPPAEGDNQVAHGTAFFLINPEGEIIKHYSGTDQEEIDQIVEDLKKLQ